MALGKLAFLCLNTACIGALGLLVLTILLRVKGQHAVERRQVEKDPASPAENRRFRYGSSYLFRQDHPYLEWVESGVPVSRRRVEADPEREMSYEP